MEIKDKEFTLKFDASTGRLVFSGLLRRMSKDYKEIQDLLDHVARSPPAKLDIDIFGLQMMNSSGLNTLSRFILGLRAKAGVLVTFVGAKDIVWHAKTLQNMKHFLPSANVVFR
jgi:hypothetical protein